MTSQNIYLLYLTLDVIKVITWKKGLQVQKNDML